MGLRYYQQDAVNAVWRHLREKDTNPCVVMPTGSGKSWVIGQLAADAVKNWNGRVLCLAHVKELLEQNAEKIRAVCPDVKTGIYSAGLNSRQTAEPVIVGGIQSVYDKVSQLGAFDLVVIDEVHMVPPDGEGMYRTLLDNLLRLNPRTRVCGLTATPYRLKGGLICKPENLLNEVCYEIGLKEMINRGFLSRLVSKSGRTLADFGSLHIRGGEFVQEDVDAAMGDERIVSSACREIAELTAERKSVILFCSSVAHAYKVSEAITRLTGEECAVVTGDTPGHERAEILTRFKSGSVPADLFGNIKGPLKYVANVECLTTGFDAPGIDTVCLLRPTNSPGLLMQMCGRGTRLSPSTGKRDCLILDYGRNIERHGCLDALRPPGERKGSGGLLAKTCPKCQALLPLPIMVCSECGYEFERKEPKPKIDRTASAASVLTGEISIDTHNVLRTEYQVWEKRGAPPGHPKTVRVTYVVDLITSFSEWLCPEHSGYARKKFEKWWARHADEGTPVAVSAQDVCEADFMGLLKPVKKIKVKHISGERYPEVEAVELGESEMTKKINQPQEEEEWDDLPF